MPPVFAHGQLRLYLLALLESGAKHGYELITALSDRFGGTYRPSPGTIYPRLARLEEEGLVHRTEDGRKTIYQLTDAGQQVLDARRDELATIEQDLAETVRGLADRVRDDVRGAMRGLRADLAAAAQSARAEATPSSPPATEWEERLGSRTRAVETEALLQQFRDEMRAELRRVSAGRGLKQLTVDTVRTVLDSARSAIRSTLG
jgi:DNA-binding PadR family transcriptional regulator